ARRRPGGGSGRHRRRHHRCRGAALPGSRGDRPPRTPRHARGAAHRVARGAGHDDRRGRDRRRNGMVNFKPTDEQELVGQTMASFAREVLRPAAREADEKNDVPETVVRRGWELGLVQSSIPEPFGGYGDARSAVTGVLLLEELGYGD